jgi:hypothetical protein
MPRSLIDLPLEARYLVVRTSACGAYETLLALNSRAKMRSAVDSEDLVP